MEELDGVFDGSKRNPLNRSGTCTGQCVHERRVRESVDGFHKTDLIFCTKRHPRGWFPVLVVVVVSTPIDAIVGCQVVSVRCQSLAALSESVPIVEKRGQAAARARWWFLGATILRFVGGEKVKA